MVGFGEVVGDVFDGVRLLENLVNPCRQLNQGMGEGLNGCLWQRVSMVGEYESQTGKGCQLRREGFRRGDTNLGTSMSQNKVVGFPRQRALGNIDEGDARIFVLARQTHAASVSAVSPD